MKKQEFQEIFAMYELAVEMADRHSSRRNNANSFYLTLQGALIAGAGLFLKSETINDGFYLSLIIFGALGIFISVAWLLTIKSYHNLSTAKWGVILELEKLLPSKPFSDEWELLDTEEFRKWKRELSVSARRKRLYKWLRERNKYYTPQSKVERFIPTTFILSYLLAVAIGIIGIVS